MRRTDSLELETLCSFLDHNNEEHKQNYYQYLLLLADQLLPAQSQPYPKKTGDLTKTGVCICV